MVDVGGIEIVGRHASDIVLTSVKAECEAHGRAGEELTKWRKAIQSLASVMGPTATNGRRERL